MAAVPIASGLLGLGGSLLDMAFRKKREKRQEQANKRMLDYQAAINDKYLDKQLAYNTPAAQMARYQEAGLNPHLIYGQGNPGNQSAPLSSPDYKQTDYQHSGSQAPVTDLVKMAFQTMLQMSQVQAVNAGTEKTMAQTSLTELQSQVVAANPLLNQGAFNAIISSLKSTAESKQAAARMDTERSSILNTRWDVMPKGTEQGWTPMEKEIFTKLDNLSKDQKIKSEILTSKEFQNQLLEIQSQWMSKGEITFQHMYQFITMLLMKAL